MRKTEKIRRLLEDNRQLLLHGETNNGLCFDGIIDEDSYNRQKLKVVVLLKETNGNDFEGNEVEQQKDFEYLHWLKHQQVNNEPELRKKGNLEYVETNVFYHHTFKKLCHWLSMLFDIIETGETTSEKYLKNGKVDIEKVRTILNNVALINLKKTWGKESTNANSLHEYATNNEISSILKKQIEILEPDIVLACSPDVFWIAKELYGVHEKDTITFENKQAFEVDDLTFLKLYHPQWYGKKENILAEEVKDTFFWIVEKLRSK